MRPIASRPAKPVIDVRRGQAVQVAVIPIRALRHVLRDMIGVGVRHAGRDVQQHVVGIAFRTDVDAVNVQVERR